MHSLRSSYKQLRLNFKILEHAYLYNLNEQTLFESTIQYSRKRIESI